MGRKITSHRGNEKIQYLAKLHAIKFENLKQMMRVKEMSLKKKKKTGLKLNIQKTKIMACSHITSWQTGKQWKQRQTLFSWAPKSLQAVTAAIKLKDACSLEKKL